MDTDQVGTSVGERVESGDASPGIRGDLRSATAFTWLALILTYRWVLVATPLLVTTGVVVASVSFRRYVAEARFVTETGEPQISGGIGALARQFGLNAGQGTGGESVAFYSRLLESREILTRVAMAEYRLPPAADEPDGLIGTFTALYGIDRNSTTEETLRAVQTLEGMISASTDVDAGLITVDVVARWPALAEQLLRQLLAEVQEFDLHKRQSRARAEREFVAGRVKQAESELKSAEADLELFFQENRSYADSPRLQFIAGTLQRTVDSRQQLYTALIQSYESARIEEVRNTPVITVVDSPEGSARPSGSIVVNAILGLMLGALLGVGLMAASEYLAHERARDAGEYQKFQRLRRASVGAFTAWTPFLPRRRSGMK